MHPYASDSGHRAKVYWTLASFSAVCGTLLGHLLRELALPIGPGSLIGPPSAFVIFKAFIWFFDRWVWKVWGIRHFLGVDTPNFAGVWEGTLTSSHGQHATKHKVRLAIKQTWSKLCVKGEFENSRSFSMTAAIVTTGDRPVLIYGFTNKPNANAPATMTTHSGTAELALEENYIELVGQYFTGRDRKNTGGMDLKKVRG